MSPSLFFCQVQLNPEKGRLQLRSWQFSFQVRGASGPRTKLRHYLQPVTRDGRGGMITWAAARASAVSSTLYVPRASI